MKTLKFAVVTFATVSIVSICLLLFMEIVGIYMRWAEGLFGMQPFNSLPVDFIVFMIPFSIVLGATASYHHDKEGGVK